MKPTDLTVDLMREKNIEGTVKPLEREESKSWKNREYACWMMINILFWEKPYGISCFNGFHLGIGFEAEFNNT